MDTRENPYSPPTEPERPSTAAERLRRVLHEMTPLERAVYATAMACYFVLGLVLPAFFGSFLEINAFDKGPFAKAIGDSIPFTNPVFVAIVAVLAAGVGAVQAAIMVRLVALLPLLPVPAFLKSLDDLAQLLKLFDLAMLFVVKLSMIVAPPLAFGGAAAMALGWLSVYETPPGFYAVSAFFTTQSFWFGIAGIATLIYTPEYEHVLPRLIAQFRRLIRRHAA